MGAPLQLPEGERNKNKNENKKLRNPETTKTKTKIKESKRYAYEEIDLFNAHRNSYHHLGELF